MTLLKFVRRKPQSTDETAIGVLTWFAIHPTNRGSNNLLINGDNKGAASAIFESGAARLPGTRGGFVAAFGNSACGDVSGNFVQGSAPNTFEPPISDDHNRYPPLYGSDGVCGPGAKRQGRRTVYECYGRAGRAARHQASAHRSAGARRGTWCTWHLDAGRQQRRRRRGAHSGRRSPHRPAELLDDQLGCLLALAQRSRS